MEKFRTQKKFGIIGAGRLGLCFGLLAESKGYTVYAWCKDNSLPVYKKNEFDQLEIATHVEKYIQ